MTEDEIKHGLLQVCKVKGWDSDFNIVGFHALCDKLKQLGADEEREACAKVCEGMEENNLVLRYEYRRAVLNCAAALQARG